MRFYATLIGLALTAGPIGRSPAAGTWSQRSRLAEQRTEAAVVFLNGRVYMMGGMARGHDADDPNQEYGPATDRCRERAPIPHARSHPGAAAMNGKIYVVGGFCGTSTSTRRISHSNTTQPPTAGGPVGVAAVNGRIHAIGGRDVNRRTVATHEVLDPATGKWTEAAPLPKARDHMATIAANAQIHVIGGRFDGSTENTGMHDVCDPKTNA